MDRAAEDGPSRTEPSEASDSPEEIIYSNQDLPDDFFDLYPGAFVKVVSYQIRRAWHVSDRAGSTAPYTVHLDASWDASKVPLLERLRKEFLRKDPLLDGRGMPWVVVSFNAWLRQPLQRPWSWLINAVYGQSVRQLWRIRPWRSVTLWLEEHLWRLRVGRQPYLLAIPALALVLVLMFFLVPGLRAQLNLTSLEGAGKSAQSITAITALVLTIGGALVALVRFLFSRSARDADIVQSTLDSRQIFSRHYNRLIRLIKEPVIVLIDGLDRCQPSYVVELLDSIQTILSEAPVVYVVAADKRWLRASYRTVYDSFVGRLDTPGRPLDYEFIEKAFQASWPVPRTSLFHMESYWRRLLGGPTTPSPTSERFAELRTEEEIVSELNRSDIKDQALLEAAIIRMQEPTIQRHTEHALAELFPFLPEDPVLIRRFFNVYSSRRSLAVLAGRDVDRKTFARWIILTVQYPDLAEYIKEHPETIKYVGAGHLPSNTTIPDELRSLYQDHNVISIIHEERIGRVLDEGTIRLIAGD